MGIDPLREVEAQVTRLRDLNGVLELAVLLGVDVICEHDSHGLSAGEWQHRLISSAARRVSDAGLFPGRFSLFTDEELAALVSADESLDGEIRFERARRGVVPGGDEDGRDAREAATPPA